MKIMQEDELIEAIKQWIRDHQSQISSVSVDIMDDTDLIGSGVLDSLGFIDLMVYLETITEEKIDLNDVDPSEFTTVRGLCRSVFHQYDLRERG